MVRLIFTLLFLSAGIVCFSQRIHGVVHYQNSGGKPAANIQVSALGCGTKYTQSDGTFILPCPQKAPGQKVKLIVGSKDETGKTVEVVNYEQLELLRVPNEGDDTPIEIIICYAGQRDEAAMRYYRIISKNSYGEYERKISEIESNLSKLARGEKEKAKLVSQIEQIKAERDSVMVVLEEQAEMIAKINQDKADESIRLAIKDIEQEQRIKESLEIIFSRKASNDIEILNSPAALRAKFAKLFNRPLDLIELNFPTFDGRYPGAVLISAEKGQDLPIKKMFRPEKLPEASANVVVEFDGVSEAGYVGSVLGNVASTEEVSLRIELQNLRMFEAEMSSDFKRALLRDRSTLNAEKRGLKPRTIVRAYEAAMAYTISKKNDTEGGVWEKIRKESIDLGGRLTNDGGIRISTDKPAIVAFESVLVDFIANNLDAGAPDDIIFRDYLVNQEASMAIELEKFRMQPGDKKVSFVALGNSKYESPEFWDLKLVDGSMDIFSEVMLKAGASNLLDTPSISEITSLQFDDLLDEVSGQLKKGQRKSLLVLYFIGHAISGPDGHLYLVLKDYKGDPKVDIGGNYMYGLAREQLEAPSSPVNGSNLGDLIDVVNAMQTVYPREIAGLYPVSKISARLEELNTPFVILVDACYSNEQMSNLRDELSLTKDGDYYGPRLEGGTDELRRYSKAISRFGDVPYLSSENVVIYSSAPGSIALGVPNPKPFILKDSLVGPLSRKIYDRFQSVLVDGEPVTYGDFFHDITDVKGLGEVRMVGATSWSDFSIIRKIKMLGTSK